MHLSRDKNINNKNNKITSAIWTWRLQELAFPQSVCLSDSWGKNIFYGYYFNRFFSHPEHKITPHASHLALCTSLCFTLAHLPLSIYPTLFWTCLFVFRHLFLTIFSAFLPPQAVSNSSLFFLDFIFCG